MNGWVMLMDESGLAYNRVIKFSFVNNVVERSFEMWQGMREETLRDVKMICLVALLYVDW